MSVTANTVDVARVGDQLKNTYRGYISPRGLMWWDAGSSLVVRHVERRWRWNDLRR